ncbi:hypothetical protein HWV62_25130 [Athelia sp. TMB]|nr:hypothetical protein HWV62_25130 [Athelia sp. TMB]
MRLCHNLALLLDAAHGGALDPKDQHILPIGTYAILSTDGHPIPVNLTAENYRARTQSYDKSGSQRWDSLQLESAIEDDEALSHQGPSSLNSIQNGLLLRSHIHDLFDAYAFGINPDNEYSIIAFTTTAQDDGLDGRQLWINGRVERKYQPSDVVLREHFKQCVLANVKGAGMRIEDLMDPSDEHDLSQFSRWGERMDCGGKSRFELELGSRLYAHPNLFAE